MKAAISYGTFNNQEEYERYNSLPLQEQAEEDFGIDIETLEVGYRKIVFHCTDGHKMVMNRVRGYNPCTKEKWYVSIAIDECFDGDWDHFTALTMGGPEFRPFIVSADDENKVCAIVTR